MNSGVAVANSRITSAGGKGVPVGRGIETWAHEGAWVDCAASGDCGMMDANTGDVVADHAARAQTMKPSPSRTMAKTGLRRARLAGALTEAT